MAGQLSREQSHELYMQEQKSNMTRVLAGGAVKLLWKGGVELPAKGAAWTVKEIIEYAPIAAGTVGQVTASMAVGTYNTASEGYGKVAGLLGDVEGISAEPEGGWVTDHQPMQVEGISAEPEGGWGYDYEDKKNKWII